MKINLGSYLCGQYASSTLTWLTNFLCFNEWKPDNFYSTLLHITTVNIALISSPKSNETFVKTIKYIDTGEFATHWCLHWVYLQSVAIQYITSIQFGIFVQCQNLNVNTHTLIVNTLRFDLHSTLTQWSS